MENNGETLEELGKTLYEEETLYLSGKDVSPLSGENLDKFVDNLRTFILLCSPSPANAAATLLFVANAYHKAKMQGMTQNN